MHHIRTFLFLALAVVLLSARETGCRRKSTSDATAQPATEVRPPAFLLGKLRSHDLHDVHTLAASAKIFYQGNGQSVSANANLIWVRDSMLWLNIRKLGIEVARALVTPDSVYLINRLDKTYSTRSIESLQREYGLPGGFAALQHTLLGSAWLLPGIDLRSDLADSQHRLSGSDGVFGAEYRLDEGAFLLRREAFFQKKENRNAAFTFENYQKLPYAGQFPYLRRIEAASPESGNTSIEIELSNVEINVPKTWRFEIPAHYERVE
jgi:Domain of unknown function (DUF4292)